MTQYLISFGAHAMDHIPGDDAPAVAGAAHAVVQEAVNAGVYVSAGGLEHPGRRAASQPSERPGCRAIGRISRDGRDQRLSPYVTALQIARGMGRGGAQRPALSRCLVVASSAPADQRRRLGQGQRSRAAEPAVVAAGSGHL
jgi:hypothetical protein